MNAEATRPRRPRTRRRALVVLVALEVLAVGALSVASAAQLTVSSSAVGVYSAARCSSATLSVHVNPTGTTTWWRHNKTAMRIVNYPTACNGMNVNVTVTNASGSPIASGSGNCSSPACTITTGSYPAVNAANASVLVATWGVPASWDSVCTYNDVLGFSMTCT